MSFVSPSPEMLATTATGLGSIGSTLSNPNRTATSPTAAVSAPADQLSAAEVDLFAGHKREYQLFAGQAASFHERLVAALQAAAGSHAGATATNDAPMQLE